MIRRLQDARATPRTRQQTRCEVWLSTPDNVRSFLRTIDGPIVLVGHSYGGFVTTNAAVGVDNVGALGYVAAFAPDEGENGVQATGLGGDEVDLTQLVLVRPFPGAAEGDGDAYIKSEIFPQAFCQDLPPDEGAVMAAPNGPLRWLRSWRRRDRRRGGRRQVGTSSRARTASSRRPRNGRWPHERDRQRSRSTALTSCSSATPTRSPS